MTSIRKVGVLGAGVMGSQIAAHLVNAGCDVLLLDVIPDWEFDSDELEDAANRNSLVLKGLAMAKSLNPTPFALSEFAKLIEIGSFSDSREKLENVEWNDDLEKLKDVDWVIEAVVEKVDIKHKLFRQVADIVSPDTIISSNTSGIPLVTLAQVLPDDLRKNFLGTHFFNPPRYQAIVEMIPTNETSKEVLAYISDFCDQRLGKTVVIAHDVPGFIANRIAIPGVVKNISAMIEDGYSIEEVDTITGKAIGWPKSATFRTLDVVGIDIVASVVNNLHEALPDDFYKETLVLPEFVNQLVANGWIGQKAGKGFYEKIKREGQKSKILAVDPQTLEYHPRKKPKFKSIKQGKKIIDTAQRIKFLINGEDRVASYLQKTLLSTLSHAAEYVSEVADDIVAVDLSMKKGFLWELGPFEIWDALGVSEVVKLLEKNKQPVPALANDVLKTKRKSFYFSENGTTYFFGCNNRQYEKLNRPEGVIILKDLKDTGHVIEENSEASLIDMRDGVWCLEFHSKMNTIGLDAISMMYTAAEEASTNDACKGLVIGNNGEHFSAGANLKLIVKTLLEGKEDKVERFLKEFQDANMALKYMPKPVVAAPFGVTFGGGSEVCLHADMVCAAHETYMGLVEVAVGLIPAGGGTKEMLLRTFENVPHDLGLKREFDPLPFIQRTLMTIGMAKVSTSAFEAKELGYLRESDVIVMNKDRLIAEAKQLVLTLSRNYQPPRQQSVILYGERLYSALKSGLYLMREGGVIGEYDEVIATQIVKVLTGGDLSEPERVSEQVVLDREREAMMFLATQDQTLERIANRIGKSIKSLKMLGLGLKAKNTLSRLNVLKKGGRK
ncbi:3-hydroxyacyl-CoA dehydrogenase/enoyl-CoA hydratase family protein [Patescibacteria group bacterium AH-259-L05]|nr:3-hydroxyacyl-CoA dehydrogenase/enoyl-CoA hydratase family protein [Patescibacteria group bacterium AH-259-L05]